MIDIHSHILPSVDDGARDMEESVEMARWLAGAGVTDVIATPHYINETAYVSSAQENKRILDRLTARLRAEGIKLNVYLGNEVYIDDDIFEMFKRRKVTALAGSNFVLIELPLTGDFAGFKEIFLELMRSGAQVILAHPERYLTIQEDFGLAKELCEMGVLLQGNLGSIVGKYGKKAQKALRKLIKARLIFGFGSDLHRCPQHDSLILAQKKLKKYYGAQELEQVLVNNPKRILQGFTV